MLKGFKERSKVVLRLQRILTVFARHGFYGIVKRLTLHGQLAPLDRLRYARLHQEEDKHTAERLRQAFEELGPSFIEFGQLLSTRHDLIPDAFARELSRLFWHTRPVPWEDIKQSLPDYYTARDSPVKTIDPEPLASASIAQIHKAVLKSGHKVVIKVQRQGIKDVIASDVVVLRMLASMMEKYLPESRSFNPRQMVEEFATAIDQELDFVLEATNMARFTQNFADDPYIFAPKTWWDLTHPHILVMDYVDGIPLDDIDRLIEASVDRKATAERLLNAFLRQIFEFGFYQADPHPGNFLVTPDSRIAFIDFGLVGYVTEAERQALADLFQAAIAEDIERVAAIWLELTRAGRDVDRSAFLRGLKPILLKHINQPRGRIQLGEMFTGMMNNGARHGLKLPSELFLVFRTMAEIEGLLRWLYIDFDVIAHCKAFAESQKWAALQPARIAKLASAEAGQWAGIARRLPQEVEDLIKTLSSGRFSIDFGHQGFDVVVGELHRSSNRIAVGLVIAALIIGASSMMLSEKGPLVWGMTAIGLAAFAVGCSLGLMLIWLVVKSGKY
ncbi:MAG: AarF/ABC1/UbiB kinase family protein [Methylocapsa sp.]|nr:AarF/ABC1/UbiB kinase family protein [Methylocapsa sp.]